VLVQGVREGRTTFANTLKYVFMATSANFGNMFSMAGASLFLPYLPLLPAQILLTNLMTNFPEMTIATDSVDSEMIDHPRRWDIVAIRKFMITFGLVSSVFDYLTFGASAISCMRPRTSSDRLVSRVGHLGVADRAGYSQPEAFLREQAGKVSVGRDADDGCCNDGFALYTAWSALRIQPGASFVPSVHRNDRRALHCLGRAW
jgi:hypothetical protein